MYYTDGQLLTFSSGKSFHFGNAISEILDFEDSLVLRLSDSPMHISNENVFGFDHRGQMLWQIPMRPSITGQSPYVSVMRKNNILVEAFNWNGYTIILQPHTGEVIQEGMFLSGMGGNQRAPSRRQWI